MSSFGLGNVWAKAMTFKQATLLLRILFQAFGGNIFIMYLFKYNISLFSNTGIFLAHYVVQSVAKIILFGQKC